MSSKTTKASLRMALQDTIGYMFEDLGLLDRALTHSSAHHERALDHNERLEFLGDRVLGLVAADFVYRAYPNASEGELSRRFNQLVRRETCARVALDLEVPACIDTGRSMSVSTLSKSVNVLGDVCEALVGALYLDGGLEVTRTIVERLWGPYLVREDAEKDPKTRLQEWALAQHGSMPAYRALSRQGPEHAPIFKMSVCVLGVGEAVGQGTSKRYAEQSAAEAFLKAHGEG